MTNKIGLTGCLTAASKPNRKKLVKACRRGLGVFGAQKNMLNVIYQSLSMVNYIVDDLCVLYVSLSIHLHFWFIITQPDLGW